MKDVPANNKGLKKLPTEVRNKMGYKAKGGMAAKKKMATGGRTVSKTDASTAKSTPPKTGKGAQLQRLVNNMASFLKNNDPASLTSAIKQAKEKAKGAKGNNVSNADKQAMRNAKKDPPNYQGKAYGGKTKMMAGGKAKKGMK